jgi:hypothetical protein
MTEAEWLKATFGLLLMEAADGMHRDADGTPMWRSVAARVACLALLGLVLPPGVQHWVDAATENLDVEDRSASADRVLYQDRNQVYAAFRDAYAHANPTLKQRLAAAQDTFRGGDYYAEEDYMLEVDESSPTYTGPTYAADSATHCDIIRDVFGNPFHPVACDPAWLVWNDGAIPKIAQALYHERQFPIGRLDVGQMAILADGLEDAGCTDSSILEHLRGPGPHVRGCHILDTLLGKS